MIAFAYSCDPVIPLIGYPYDLYITQVLFLALVVDGAYRLGKWILNLKKKKNEGS
jgi:hypothetical protein